MESRKREITVSGIKRRRKAFLAVVMALLMVLCATPLSDSSTVKAASVKGQTVISEMSLKGFNGMPSDVFAGNRYNYYNDGSTLLGSDEDPAPSPPPVIYVYYTITWKQDNGTTINTTSVRQGNTPTHATPTKAKTAEFSYTFAGWTPTIVRATRNATYTATYTQTRNKYTITWVDDEGKTIDTTEVEYGQVPVHEDAVKEKDAEYTYTFKGWDPEPVAVTGAATYKATFDNEKNKYKVSFVDEDGSTVLKAAEEYDYGTSPEDIAQPKTPTKEKTDQYSYEFAGWSPELKEVTEDAVYTATYTDSVNKYSVTFVDDDGSTVLKEAKEYEYGTPADMVEKPDDPEKAADDEYTYSFDKWNPEITDVIADKIYKAVYTAVKNKYTVTFVDEDGETVLKEAQEYEYGTSAGDIEVPANPTKEGNAEFSYTFAGWSPEIDQVTKNITYRAAYNEVKNKYSITFMQADGKTVYVENTYDYGTAPEDIEIPEGPEKAADDEHVYTFIGWSPEIDVVSEDIVYIPQYKTEDKPEEVITEEATEAADLTTEEVTTEATTTEATTTQAATTQAPATGTNVETVKTGDDSASMLKICFILMMLSALSMVGILAVSYFGRRSKEKDE